MGPLKSKIVYRKIYNLHHLHKYTFYLEIQFSHFYRYFWRFTSKNNLELKVKH